MIFLFRNVQRTFLLYLFLRKAIYCIIIASVPIGRAGDMKESYDNIYLLVKHIQHDKYTWHIYGDLKVSALLLD